MKTWIAVAATLAAAILWGTSFSVNDAGLRYVGPATFAFLRFAIAGGATLLLLAALRRVDTHLVRQPWFWGLAAANAAGFLLQYLGQTLTTPARTALFVNTSAFAVAILERAVFHVPIGVKRLLAILCGVAGAAVLIVGDDITALRGGQLTGDLLTAASGIAWSVYFVFNGRAVQREDPIHLTAWTFAGTAIILLPTILLDPYLGDHEPLRMTLPGALAILYSGLVTTALAFGLWTYGLRAIRPTTSSVLLLVEILVASLVSYALGRESFGLVELAGAALLVGAVLGISLVGAHDSDPRSDAIR